MGDADDIDAYAVNEQLKALKVKYNQLELKRKEADLGVNKNLTELKSLRSQGKQWTEASRVVYTGVYNATTKFETDVTEITDKVKNGIDEAEDAIERSISALKRVGQVVIEQQRQIKELREDVAAKAIKIDTLEVHLRETTEKLEYLQDNIATETESQCGPMRDQVTDTMFLMMKEKVIRLNTSVNFIAIIVSAFYFHFRLFKFIPNGHRFLRYLSMSVDHIFLLLSLLLTSYPSFHPSEP